MKKESWRKAWISSEFTGQVALTCRANGEEFLEIRSPEVMERYGENAEILDDGRSIHVSVNDVVAFGVLKEKKLIAVNVWRITTSRKAPEEATEEIGAKQRKVLQASAAAAVAAPVRVSKETSAPAKPPNVFQASPKAAAVPVAAVSAARAAPASTDAKASPMPTTVTLPTPVARAASGKASPKAAAPAVAAPAAARADAPKAKAKASPKAAAPAVATLAPAAGPASKGKAIRMLGIVQKRQGLTGRFSVFCQDISDVYGKDAEIPPEHVPANLKVGDKISFTVHESEELQQASVPIWARDVQVHNSRWAKPARALGDGEDLEGAEELSQEQRKEAVLIEDSDEEDEAAVEVLDNALPRTPEEWAAAQSKFFPGSRELQRDWIRIRSKSTGKVYFYNMVSGVSTDIEPRV